MYTLISYPFGTIIEGVIVSQTPTRMRVLAAGLSDALELRRAATGWIMENGEAVQFEFLAVDSPAGAHVCAPPLKAHGAGSAAV